MVRDRAPDLVLLDVMMPGMDGFEACRRIKSDPSTSHIPVVMVTALNDVADRVRGLEAGADDFLTKPVNDVALFARIRSLVRLKQASDEWRSRETTFIQFGVTENGAGFEDDPDTGHILFLLGHPDASQRLVEDLRQRGNAVTTTASGDDARSLALKHDIDLILVDDDRKGDDALRLCSRLRSDERTRQSPILLMGNEGDSTRLAKALELGVNDYIVKPVDRDELYARARSQIRRKRYEDHLRANYRKSVAAALTDDLTGLNNRRYLEAHFLAVERMLASAGKPVSLMIIDVDRFKSVNDSHGHAVGDVVLQGVAGRILDNLRGFDTAVRYGGEEFVILMPNTPSGPAYAAAERLCHEVDSAPFALIGAPGDIRVTVSIGLVTELAGDLSLNALMRHADGALYEAKRGGRNRIVVADSTRSTESDHALVG